VSETDLGRALQFMQEPQDVEVYRGGDWVLGSMIGWRREEGCSCRIMVRLAERGEEKTAWADLQDVRLPEDDAFPGTQSLPFLPRLPQEWTEQSESTETMRSREEPPGPLNFVAPVTFDDPRTDARDRSTALETGRDRAAAALVQDPSDDAPTSWWPSWAGPADSLEEEPTRLLTLRRPRQR
jgi:hypothetical protein